MPDTPATRAIVTAAYTRWLKRKMQYVDKNPGITKADVDNAYKALQAANRNWEKPGESETELKKVRQVRDSVRKRLWPEFKKKGRFF